MNRLKHFETDPAVDGPQHVRDGLPSVAFDRDLLSVGPNASHLSGVAAPRCRWMLPQPFEASYGYPVLLWACDSATEYDEVAAWADAIGLQNMAIVAVDCSASTDQLTLAELVRYQFAQAWLTKPEELEVRLDRVFAVGRGVAGAAAVEVWLGGKSSLAGVAAIQPSDVCQPQLLSGSASGRLLVVGEAGWRPAAKALFAAGCDVELRPSVRDLPTTASLIANWVMRAIPTAIGVR